LALQLALLQALRVPALLPVQGRLRPLQLFLLFHLQPS
jgi:hypothetical protein